MRVAKNPQVQIWLSEVALKLLKIKLIAKIHKHGHLLHGSTLRAWCGAFSLYGRWLGAQTSVDEKRSHAY